MPRLMFAFLILALFPARAWASADEALPRIGNWEISYDQNACRLRAQFGDAQSPVSLTLTRYGAGSSFDLVLANQAFKATSANTNVRVTFFPEKVVIQRRVATGLEGAMPAIVIPSIRLDNRTTLLPESVDPAIETTVDWLEINLDGMKPIQLRTGSMAAPFKALRTCTDDLVQSWGHDLATADRLVRTPLPDGNPANWVTVADYPPNARRVKFEGITRFRIDIDAAGKPRGCAITGSSGLQEMDAHTCALMMARSKFKPALDKDGVAVAWYWFSSVRWQLPR